nr:pyridoxamine 5'-phosphate oxidase family protein [Flexivirga oryzae]
MTAESARELLVADGHGVLCTVHPRRGVDAVPVVYAITGEYVGIPIDTVKPKSSTNLQRERNLRADPRATLLVEHWEREDWSRLWWVRAQLRWREGTDPALAEELAGLLASSFPQYHQRPFAKVLILQLTGLTGWAAEGG